MTIKTLGQGQTDRPTDRPTEIATYKAAIAAKNNKKKNRNEKQITNTSPKKQVTINKLQIIKKNQNNKYELSKNK